MVAEHAAAQTSLSKHIFSWIEGCGRAIARCENRAQRLEAFWNGLLDYVTPLEPSTRDELRREKIGLPWDGRLEISLYWRIMYAALAEARRTADALDVPAWRNAASARLLAEAPFRAAGRFFFQDELSSGVYEDVVRRAQKEIRLRSGGLVSPEPLELGSIVRTFTKGAILEAYGFDGRLLLDRETEPAGSPLEWTCLAGRRGPLKAGRWQAWAEPKDVTPMR